MPATDQPDLRVLVLAPLGRDGPVTAALLRDHGVDAIACADAADACRLVAQGAGALLLTEEALELEGTPGLLDQLRAQPPWSELPLIILTRGGESHLSRLVDLAAEAAGGVTLLERPLGANTLLRTVEAALRSRRRQYQVRDLLDQQRHQAEERERLLSEVQTERDRVTALVASMRDEVWFADTQKRFTLANPAALKQFGLETDGMVDVETLAANLEVLRPDGSPRPLEEAPPLRALMGEVVSNQEEIIRTPATGALCYRQVNAAPVKSKGGQIIGSVSVVRDITEQKRAEVELARTTELLETLLAASPLGFCYLDRELRYVRINERLAAMNGIPAADHIGKTVAEIVPSLVSAVQEVTRRILATGQAVVGQEFMGETALEPGGRRYWSESWYPVRDASGTIAGFGAIVEDITPRKQAEAALRESEERLQEALRASHSFAFEWEPASDRVTRSLSCAALLGLEGEAITTDTGRSFFERVHPEDRERFVATVTRLKPNADRYDVRYRFLRPDAGVTVLEESGRGYFDASGKLSRLIGVTTDVTARVQAEAALRASEELNRRTLQALPAHIAVLDREGRIIATNQAWEEFAAQNQAAGHPSVAVGASYLAVCRRATTDQSASAVEALAGLESVLAGRQAQFTMEYPCHSPQAQRWFYMTVVPLGAPGEGGAVVTHINITERKQAEAALRQSQEDLARAQEVGQIGSWRLDTRKNVLSWSDENHRIFGVPKGTPLTYETFLAIVHPDDRQQVDARWQAGLRGEPYDIEHRLVAEGRVKWVREKAYLEFDEAGRLLGGFGITQDISERKQAENALREGHARLKKVLEVETVGVMFWDLATGRMTDANDTFLKLMGYSRRDVEAGELTWQSLTPPEYVEVSLAEIQKFHVTGRVGPYEKEYFCKDGTRRWLLFAGSSLGNNACVEFCVDIAEQKKSEAALREANERFELVLAGAGGAIWDWDVSRHRVLYSPRWKAMRGFSDAEVSDTEEEWSQSIHPEDAPRVMAAVQAHFEGQTRVFAEEYRVRRKDGSWFWIADHGLALRDANGRVVRMAGSEVDITERKQAEEALRESESFYRQTLESIPGMVFTTRPDGYCDYQSQPWVDFTGVPLSEHLGDGWNKLLHPEDRPRAFAAWRDAVEGRAPYDLEYRVRRRDGEYEWFKVRGRPIRNEAGEIVRWFGTVLNIDDLVRAKVALERSERLYRAIGESIDYGIWICEPDGRNTYASDSFLKLVGLTQEQCSSFGWGEVLHPDDAERTLAAWKECVRTGGTWDIEHRFRGVDGQWHPILARGVPVRDEAGQVLCWAGINLDISRLKITEDQLKSSLQEKVVLLQEIHHRVKNNLQVITSLINLQTATQTDPALHASLGDVRDRVRAMALVHEKLYQSGDLARVNFADYATSLLQHLWRAHGSATAPVRLTLNLQPVALPVDTAVPCGLILNELASNALKHAFPSQTGGEVTVSLSLNEASGEVCLRVADNGPGLPPNLNWRESSSLGLRLVQMLSQQLNGSVEMVPGPGAEFRIRFPLRQRS